MATHIYLVALGVHNILRSSTAVDGALGLRGRGGGDRLLDGRLSLSGLLDGLLGGLLDRLLGSGPGSGGGGRRGGGGGLLGGSVSRGGAGRPVPSGLKLRRRLILLYFVCMLFIIFVV